MEVRLAHGAPADVEPFRRFFGVPVHFDAERNALVFAAGWLEHRSPTADPQLHRFLQQHIEAFDARRRDDFPTQVRSVLRTALLTGHGAADSIAAMFSMHSRTLNRRLSKHGISFRALFDAGRFEIARQMLQDSTQRIEEIAAALGYSDAPSRGPSAAGAASRRPTGGRSSGCRTPAGTDRKRTSASVDSTARAATKMPAVLAAYVRLTGRCLPGDFFHATMRSGSALSASVKGSSHARDAASKAVVALPSQAFAK